MKNKHLKRIFVLFTLLIFVLTACTSTASPAMAPSVSSGQLAADVLTVVFVDVGQGDSTLIITPNGKSILVDAGEANQQDAVFAAIDKYELQSIDVVIGTHAHSDHIGGLEAVLHAYGASAVYLPNAPHTSSVYMDLLDCIDEKNIPLYEATSGYVIEVDPVVTIELFGPVRNNYANLNDSSAVIKVSHKDVSVLITGDAEKSAGQDLIDMHGNHLSSTVLRLPHHGSNTAATSLLLPYVKPAYAVISCGLSNSYGHPHTETLLALQEKNITTYRTDELGNITLVTDGKDISFDKDGAIPRAAVQNLDYVYITDTGKTYHRIDCSSLSKSKNKIAMAEAVKQGYTACKRCFKN